MSLGQWVLLGYAILMLLGGLCGTLMPAGTLMAISLVAAVWLGYSAWIIGG